MEKIYLPYKLINIKEYFKTLIKKHHMRGLYDVLIYYDDNNTILEIKKKNNYLKYVDINLKIKKTIFLYEVEDIINDKENIIYNNKIYIKENIYDFTKKTYKDTEKIIKNGKKINNLI